MSVSPQVATGRDGADDQVTRLMREVAVLKHEIRQLTSAQQEAAETIASLQAALQDARGHSAYWYSESRGLDIRVREPAGARHCRDHLAATRDGARETWRRSQARTERRADVVGSAAELITKTS